MDKQSQKLIAFLVISMTAIFGVAMSETTQNPPKAPLQSSSDVGVCKIPGNTIYDAATQTYTIGGSGQNMWFKHDDFHYVWKKMNGDFILTARFAFIGAGINAHRKIGWMVRKTLEPNSPYADAVVHGDGLTSLQFRRDFDMDTEEVKTEVSAPDVVQFERSGETYTMRVAHFGEPLQETGNVSLALGDSVYIGLVICSHEEDKFEEAQISNVRIEVPAPAGFRPYQDYGGSRLETIDIESGNRFVIYESPDPLEAPNWTCDGKALIYNSKGLLYRFDLSARQPQLINTGVANQNNNDHVLSFNGKMLGISNHVEGEAGGGSAIFTVPTKGGKLHRVTALTPSYLHGWSPDGKFLIYTAERNGQFDIYKIAVEGGEEKQLTNQKMLDDGSEYTADGQWIYFNSARTGTMKVWRMHPDGTQQKQVTFDQWNDWFPHSSPDGKWLLFLSFPPDVDAQSHPHYKHVMLRLMPRAGGEIKTIAYLYGGQGTINVPSWSPDSKKAAFVSYTF